MKINLSNLSLAATVLVLTFVFSVFAQQTERERGVALYKQNDFGGAVASLKKATKADAADEQSWYYLGLAYLKNNETKSAIKALQKAVELKPGDAAARVGLAYAFLLRNNVNEAAEEARKAVQMNPKSSEAYYVSGVVASRYGSYAAAYDDADKAVKLNPNFAAAYLLKTEALIASFIKQTGTVMKPKQARGEMLDEAAQNLEKYLSLSPPNDETKFYAEYLESVKFFADHYNNSANQLPANTEIDAQPTADATPFKITSKPRANYTERARNARISGTIELIVGFAADGKVKHILVVKPLGYGLDQEAVKAARGIKFQPPVKDGKPVSTVRRVQYNFSIG